MKWLFLISNACFMPEFLGKMAQEMIQQGDECIVVFNSKIAECDKKKFFPEEAKFISMFEWNFTNYSKNKEEFTGLSWKEFFPIFDRFYPSGVSYEKSFQIVLQACCFFEFIFKEGGLDAIISEPPAGLSPLLAYSFCKKNNKPYLGLCASRFSDRIDVYDSIYTFSEYEKTFSEIVNGDLSEEEKKFAEEFLKKFISHKQLPSYMGFSKIYFSQWGLLIHFIKRVRESGLMLLKCFVDKSRFKDSDYETQAALNDAIKSLWTGEKRKFRIFLHRNVFDNLEKAEKFFFFPLHFQPEASTSVWATYYCDQINTIKNIAFSLPFPYKLVVKEHPVAVGTRSKSFYRKLKAIPNVVLVSPEENIENIIKNSFGVITLSGNPGLEAALSGKVVYVLGDAFYSYHPVCRRVASFEDLKNKIEKDLSSGLGVCGLKDINNRFIASYLRNTIEGNIISASQGKDTNNYKLIYQNLCRFAKK